MKRSLNFLLFIAVIIPGMMACGSDPMDVDVSDVPANMDIRRFDVRFFDNDSAHFHRELPEIKAEFPIFFTNGDSLTWRDRRFDRQLRRLWSDVKLVYEPEVWEEVRFELEDGFRHLNYYYPHWPGTTVYTYVSNLDFNYPILYLDSLNALFAGLDVYLGQDHPAYTSLPRYIARRHTPEYLVPDVFEIIGRTLERNDPDDQSLLNLMIRMGKIRYFQEAMLRHKSEAVLFGYTQEQIDFCSANERNIWMYFIEEQLLFNTSTDTHRRFMAEAPFSKFGMAFDSETPGRVGEWVGWRIVHSFMENHPDITLPELMEIQDARELFTKSRYKPS